MDSSNPYHDAPVRKCTPTILQSFRGSGQDVVHHEQKSGHEGREQCGREAGLDRVGSVLLDSTRSLTLLLRQGHRRNYQGHPERKN